MTTFENLWESLCKKCNDLRDPAAKVEFRSDNLKKLLEQMYDQGAKHSKEQKDLFGNLFRGF